MQNQQENLDQIIRKNFPKDIAFKRVQKEISMLSSLNNVFYKVSMSNSPIGLKILVETSKAALQNFCDPSLISSNISIILFEILLEPKFPFVFPKIFCRTTFSKPSIADGRDILIDIIKKTWTPSILLHEIITIFPIFVKEVLSKSRDIALLQKIGTYHLGGMYNLEDFLLMDTVDVFPVNELMPNNKTIPRYLVLSQSNILNFEIIDRKNNQVKLISWANLQSLLNIKRKKDEQYTLVLTWKDAHKPEGLTQIIALEQANKFCELTMKNMKNFGIKISKNIIKQPDLTLDDVTVKAYEQIDIMDLLENITILESRLPEEFTIDIVNTLMMLYQKAIEYYSALNDPAYDDYLEKMHLLLSREDVQILLRSKEETKKGEKIQKGKKQTQPNENEQEEEEEKKENPGNNNNSPDRNQNYSPSPPKKTYESKSKHENESANYQEKNTGNKTQVEEKKPEIKQENQEKQNEDLQNVGENSKLEDKNQENVEMQNENVEKQNENVENPQDQKQELPSQEQQVINEVAHSENANKEETNENNLNEKENSNNKEENQEEQKEESIKNELNENNNVNQELDDKKEEGINQENNTVSIEPSEIIKEINQTLDLAENHNE